MDNTLYVSLSRQMTLRKELDVVANNIANADTAGFKVESLMVANDPVTPPAAPGAAPIQFSFDNGLARDFSQSLGLSLSCCFSGFCCQTSRYLGLFLALPFSLFFMASPLFR